jgi:hypothetical protein
MKDTDIIEKLKSIGITVFVVEPRESAPADGVRAWIAASSGTL